VPYESRRETLQIAIITPYKHFFGGVETFNKLLKNIFQKHHFEVDFITLDEAKNLKYNRLLQEVIGAPYITSRLFERTNKTYDVVICNGEFSYGIHHPRCINIFHGTAYGYRKYLSHYLNFKQNLFLFKESYVQKIGARNKYIIAVSNFALIPLEAMSCGVPVNYVTMSVFK